MPWTRSRLIHEFQVRGLRPQRKLGQNFLVDRHFLQSIVREAQVDRDDTAVEIGAGVGNLTEVLADRAGHVWAFEIDPGLYTMALETVTGRDNVTLVNADGAEFSRTLGQVRRRPLKIVSNLPYSDYYRILLALLSSEWPIKSCVLLLQADVYDKLRASPGTSVYGPLSVLVQACCTLKRLKSVSPMLFYPMPRVESVLFRLEWRPQTAVEPYDMRSIEKGLRAILSHRRKKLRAVLRGLEQGRIGETLPPKLLDRRAEDLSPENLVSLARIVRAPS